MNDRCVQCIMPANYLGISFDQEGVCSYCKNHKNIKYLGLEEMKKDIYNIIDRKKDRKFDCVLGLSGGRDSNYMLHILRNELNLNPLVYFIDHDFIPEHTRQNVIRIASKCNVKLMIEKSRILTHCFYYEFNAWKKHPTPATLPTFCMGCKGRVIFTDYKLAIKYRIPLIINAGTPFEYVSYKSDLVKINPKTSKKTSYFAGYFRQVIKNPLLVLDPKCFLMQGAEFIINYNFNPFFHKFLQSFFNVNIMVPFWKYIRWEEKKVLETIQKVFEWKNFPAMSSTWRGDCYIGPIRQYLYHVFLGYNDKDVHLSALIRDRQLCREEAINRLKEEHLLLTNVAKICCEKSGINFNELQNLVEEYKKKLIN